MKSLFCFVCILSFFNSNSSYGTLTEGAFYKLCKEKSETISIQNTVATIKTHYRLKKCLDAQQKLNESENIFLYCNNTCDLKPFSGLKKLVHLEIINGQISNLSPLSNLSLLKKLNLYQNQIEDLRPLSKLSNLEWLNLRKNNCKRINMLKNLSKIKILELASNQVKDISVLSSVKTLIDLDLSDNQITDISAIKRLKKLRNLDISHNKITDISPLKDMHKLQNFQAYANPVIKTKKKCPFGKGVAKVISDFCRKINGKVIKKSSLAF